MFKRLFSILVIATLLILSCAVQACQSWPSQPVPPSQSESLLPSIADLVAEVKPVVVAIRTEAVAYDLYNRPFIQQGAGSGWIIDESGTIVTNSHVVQEAERVTVVLWDNRVFVAESISADSLTDLAVVKVSADNLSAAKVSDLSELRVGDWVVAIGNPLGMGISAKEGIVSRLGAPISVAEGQILYGLIETSAAINPGNSGGPLFDMAGEVVGITSAKISRVGVEGMGYAISISSAKPIVDELLTTGYIIRPWLGVESFTVDQGLALRFGLAVNRGALVTDVAPNSPASKAAIQQGDIIVGFQDTEIASAQDLRLAELSSQVGEKVMVRLWRGISEMTVDVIMVESPPPQY